MSTRQYIGARYVPKFFDYGGSPEWISNTAYEALTIVTRNGNSYTSKIPVPSNVGAPESNPDYWVSTGIYNEQIEAYRQEVQYVSTHVETAEGDIDSLEGRMDTAEGDIDSLEGRMGTAEGDIDSLEGRMGTAETNISILNREVITRRYVLVGDSYSVGSTDGGFITGWSSIFKTLSGLGDSDCYIFDYGGSGFVGHVANTFEQLLVGNYSSVSNPNTITDVVFAGGYNDHDATISDLDTAIASAINRAKTLFPNAHIWVSMCGYSSALDSTVREHLVAVAQHYKNIALINQAVYIADSEYVLPLNPASNMSGDRMHPTQNGYNLLGRGLYCAVSNRTGLVPITVEPAFESGITLTPEANVTVANLTLLAQITGRTKRVFIISRPHTFLFTNPITVDWIDTIEFGTFSSTIFGLHNYRYTVRPVNCWLKSDGKFYKCQGNIFIRDGKLGIQFENPEEGGTGGVTFTDVTEISFGSTYIDFDSRLL